MTAWPTARAAAENPSEVALRDHRHALRWGEVDRYIRRIAVSLLARGDDDRVAIYAENAAEVILCHLGGLAAGRVTVPISFHLTADETAYILEDSQAGILFVGPENLERGLRAAAPSVLVVCWGDTAGTRAVAFEAWLEQEPEAAIPDLPVRPHLLYTSGTTGRPKGTEMPPGMFPEGSTYAEHLAQVEDTHPLAKLGTHLVVGPLHHTGPLSSARLLAVGVPIVILRRFDALATLHAIETYRVASSQMVPTHFVRLLALPDDVRQKFDPSSLVAVGQTGSSCPVDVKQAMIEWWGPVFLEAYGASEVGVVCLISSDEWLLHPGSVGRCVEPFEPVVVDDDEQPVPVGTQGRLYFRDATGRGIIYHGDPEKSAAAHLEPGVFTLGEIGIVDAEGYVFITDRFADMVVSGGVNIYPAESEQILLTHPDVADAACVGVPDRDMGETLIALVVPRDTGQPPDAEALIDHCRKQIAKYKCPRSVEFVDDLDRNAMGKLNKRALRARVVAP